MNRRQQGQRVKQIVKEITGFDKVSVRSGTGSALDWWYITIEERPTEEQKDRVEELCAEENLLGYYWSDYGYGLPDKRYPNVLWKNKEGRGW